MAETDLFKWRHYESEIILLCVRWYLRTLGAISTGLCNPTGRLPAMTIH